ncbi:nitrogen fixation protein NifQ [Achromobacter xylosoxidans]
MDHALVADESSRLLACTLLRHAQPDDPDAAFFATVLGKCLALGDPGRSGLPPASCARYSRPCSPARWTTPARSWKRCDRSSRPMRRAAWTIRSPVFAAVARAAGNLERARAGHHPAGQLRAHARLPAPRPSVARPGPVRREDVTALLTRHYPGLAARNVRNLRWKQYLAYAACEHAGLPPTAAPGCPGCEDHEHCYGGAAA